MSVATIYLIDFTTTTQKTKRHNIEQKENGLNNVYRDPCVPVPLDQHLQAPSGVVEGRGRQGGHQRCDRTDTVTG